LGIVAWFPLRTHLTRLVIILSLLGIVGGGIILAWRRAVLRYVLQGMLLLAGALVLLPGRQVDTAALRATYASRLLAYRGVPYVWGGENGRGVDCSGLVRAGLIDAEWNQALATANPHLLRAAGSLWWNKCNARWLMNGYQDRTRLLFATPALNAIDDARLEPGDFAVTADGIHTLAYIGDATWIQADPDSQRVMTIQARRDNNGYLRVPMHIMRWRVLETANNP